MAHEGTRIRHKLALRGIEDNRALKLFLIVELLWPTTALDVHLSGEVHDGDIGVFAQIQIDDRHFMIRRGSTFLIESHVSSLVHLMKTFLISFCWATGTALKPRLSFLLHFSLLDSSVLECL